MLDKVVRLKAAYSIHNVKLIGLSVDDLNNKALLAEGLNSQIDNKRGLSLDDVLFFE